MAMRIMRGLLGIGFTRSLARFFARHPQKRVGPSHPWAQLMSCAIGERLFVDALIEAQQLYRSSGYREVVPFNDEPYAHHWFEKTLVS